MNNLLDSIYDVASPEERLHMIMSSEVLQQGISYAHRMKDNNTDVAQLLVDNAMRLTSSIVDDKVKFSGGKIHEDSDSPHSKLNYYSTIALANSVAMRMRIKELNTADANELLESFDRKNFSSDKPSEVGGMLVHLSAFFGKNYYPDFKEPISNSMIPCAIDVDEGRTVLTSSDQSLFNELVGGLFYYFYDGNPHGEKIPLDSGLRSTH